MNDINFFSMYKICHVKLQETENVKEITPFQRSLEKSQKEHIESVIKSVTEIRGSLETLKGEVYNNVKEHSANYFRKKMFDMENKISGLKDLIKDEMCALLKEEVNLFKELQFTEKRLEEWGKPVNAQIYKPIKQSAYKIHRSNDSNPITEFQKYLSTAGGHYGGWEEQDHLVFLRERNRHKANIKFLSAVQVVLPDLMYDDIVQHEEWYKKYEELKNSQKEAIRKWKEKKATLQERKLEVLVEKKDTKPSKKAAHQINIAERIKEWKKQQLIRKAEEEERQKEEQLRLRDERRKNREIQKLKKQAVNQYKAQKLNKIQEEILVQQENKHETGSKAERNALIKAFRLQDLKYVERKKIIRLQSETKSRGKLEKIKLTKPVLDIVLQRDPKRVLQPTLIWSQHCQTKKEKSNPVYDLDTIPRLAIPEWRKELK